MVVFHLFDRKGRLTFLHLSMNVRNKYIAKIVSLKHVKNIPVVRVTMDTSIENAMNVIMSDGTVFKFKECGSGL